MLFLCMRYVKTLLQIIVNALVESKEGSFEPTDHPQSTSSKFYRRPVDDRTGSTSPYLPKVKKTSLKIIVNALVESKEGSFKPTDHPQSTSSKFHRRPVDNRTGSTSPYLPKVNFKLIP